MHAAPGAYAVLLGSGISTAAGIPTGWQVVQDLIRKVAIARGVDPEEVASDPEVWWSRQGNSEARYDTLLTALAPTDATRQAMLRNYFDPPPGSQGPVLPTAAHDALATLCVTGRVKLIVTTNFDRLMERALDRVGVSAQVIASPSAVRGMIPLTQASMTVVKLHGDYASPGLRNTPEELASYPTEWRELLARVFDEFGMLVVGWSAEYDTGLRQAFTDSPSRRYPAYWATYLDSLTEDAKRLIDHRQANVIRTLGADEFLGDLAERVERFDRVAARRVRPTALRSYFYYPEHNTPQGWSTIPLLQLPAVATVGPATVETCGIFRPEHRDALIGALQSARVTNRLRELSLAPTAVAAEAADSALAAVDNWAVTPEAHQSSEHCNYRLGGDASAGLSALVTVSLHGFAQTGASVVIKFDVALSLASALSLAEAARIMADGLVLTTSVIPEALDDVLPADSEVTHAELHIVAAPRTGTPDHPYNQPNDLLQRLDLATLGERAQFREPSLGFAAHLAGALTEQQAAELTVGAIDYMVLASGWLDPRNGIAQLRRDLGIPGLSGYGSTRF
jgi:hypothetical protein